MTSTMRQQEQQRPREQWWKHFQIVFYLATPVALNHPWLHLDGLISHLVALRVLGRDYYVLPTKTVTSLSAKQLGRYQRVLRQWWELPQASVSFFHPDDLFSLRYFKRFEPRGFPGERKIDLGRGHYRTWMLRHVYCPAETVTFYGTGDLELVRDLLSDLTHIGNDNRVGWGRIHRLEVTELPEDRSLVWEGKAMRPIPIRFLRKWEDAVPLAWRPPYWAAENVEVCAPPGARVVLKGRGP
ncbi:MAG: hypothetical protein RB148_12825 [Armatimonadota bacterium]|nr:hypothetical protein [Armatimonadota bacterium]